VVRNSHASDASQEVTLSAELYRKLVEDINDVVFMIGKDGVITYVSPRVEKLSGFTVNEIVGRRIYDFVHPDDVDEARRHFRMALSGLHSAPEFRLNSKNGEPVCVSASSRRHFERGELAGLFGVITDITEKKRTEIALRRNEQTARALLNAAMSAAFLLDLRGVILAANETAAKGLGQSVDALVGRLLIDFFPRNVAEERARRGMKVIQTAQPESFEDEVEGRIFYSVVYPVVDESGKVSQLAIYSSDVTERKRMEEELARRREQLEETVRLRTRQIEDRNEQLVREIEKTKRAEAALYQKEALLDSVLSHTDNALLALDKDRKVIFYNQNFSELWELEPEFLDSSPRVEDIIRLQGQRGLYPPDITESLVSRRLQELRQNRLRHFIETPRTDGKILETYLTPLPQGGHLMAFRDVTEKQRIEKALQENEEKFRKIFDIIPVAASIYDIKDDRYLQTNRAFTEITGYTKAEVTGRSVKELKIINPDELQKIISLFPKKKDQRDVEVMFSHKNGAIRTGLMSAIEITLGSQTCALSATMDITDRKDAEELLTLQHDLSLALNSLNSLEHSLAVTLRFCLRIPELHCGGFLRSTPELTCHEGLSSAFVDSFNRASSGLPMAESLRQGKPFYLTKLGIAGALGRMGKKERLKSMAVLPVNLDETVTTFIMVASRSADIISPRTGRVLESFVSQLNDTIVRIKAQRQVVEQERYLSTVLESSMDSIVVTDSDRNVIDCNASFLTQFGYERFEVIGKPTMMIYKSKKSFEKFGAEVIPEALRDGHWRGEWEYRRKDGGVVPMELVMSLMKRSGPQQERFVTIMRDIARRKASEKKLLDYQTNLKKLASELSSFEEKEHRRIASHLHDGLVQTLVFSKLKLEELNEELKSARHRGVAAQLMNLLDLSIDECRSLVYELSPPVLYELGITAGLQWLVSLFEKQHGVSISLMQSGKAMKLPDNISSVLFRAAKELLTNTIKHSGAQRVGMEIKFERNTVVLCVKDDGRGFDSDKGTEYSADTTGFGLFNLKERVENIGGKLKIDSSPGAGATVIITAPVDAPHGLSDV